MPSQARVAKSNRRRWKSASGRGRIVGQNRGFISIKWVCFCILMNCGLPRSGFVFLTSDVESGRGSRSLAGPRDHRSRRAQWVCFCAVAKCRDGPISQLISKEWRIHKGYLASFRQFSPLTPQFPLELTTSFTNSLAVNAARATIIARRSKGGRWSGDDSGAIG
jgi:hypothetical protein